VVKCNLSTVFTSLFSIFHLLDQLRYPLAWGILKPMMLRFSLRQVWLLVDWLMFQIQKQALGSSLNFYYHLVLEDFICFYGFVLLHFWLFLFLFLLGRAWFNFHEEFFFLFLLPPIILYPHLNSFLQKIFYCFCSMYCS